MIKGDGDRTVEREVAGAQAVARFKNPLALVTVETGVAVGEGDDDGLVDSE